MQLHPKALYNALRLHFLQDPTLSHEPWQVEDYRQLTEEELFKRLKFKKEHFLAYAKEAESPEELAQLLISEDKDPKEYDKFYLLIFELFRRLKPEEKPLSIFFDELDHLISLFDKEMLENDEPLLEALQELEDILDDEVDQGAPAKKAYQNIKPYLAHDLERFLYDFISEEIYQGDRMVASEWIDNFYPYMQKPYWFDFLHAQLLFDVDQEKSVNALAGLLEEHKDPEFLKELKIFCIEKKLSLRVLKG